MQERSHLLAANLALLTKREHRIRRSRALARDRTLQALVADLVAARTAAGMTQEEVAVRMWTTKSAVSRLESGVRTRPTLSTIEKYALAVGVGRWLHGPSDQISVKTLKGRAKLSEWLGVVPLAVPVKHTLVTEPSSR